MLSNKRTSHENPLSSAPIRLSLSLSADASANLDSLATQAGSTKGEVLRRALALYTVAQAGIREHQRFALLDQENHIIKEIVAI